MLHDAYIKTNTRCDTNCYLSAVILVVFYNEKHYLGSHHLVKAILRMTLSESNGTNGQNSNSWHPTLLASAGVNASLCSPTFHCSLAHQATTQGMNLSG